MHNGFSFLGWSLCILLLCLASFGATSRPLSGLRGWSGLRLASSGCTLGHICRARGSGTIDSGMRAFIDVDLASVLIIVAAVVVVINKLLLVQESGQYIDQCTGRGACKWGGD